MCGLEINIFWHSQHNNQGPVIPQTETQFHSITLSSDHHNILYALILTPNNDILYIRCSYLNNL